MLKICIDTNVWISGLLFSGPSSKVVDSALENKFTLICSDFILEELKRNLINKFKLTPKFVKQLINDIILIADIYEPMGKVDIIKEKHADNLILETAFLGDANYLITGDKKHLLPLKEYAGIKIISPADFEIGLLRTIH